MSVCSAHQQLPNACETKRQLARSCYKLSWIIPVRNGALQYIFHKCPRCLDTIQCRTYTLPRWTGEEEMGPWINPDNRNNFTSGPEVSLGIYFFVDGSSIPTLVSKLFKCLWVQMDNGRRRRFPVLPLWPLLINYSLSELVKPSPLHNLSTFFYSILLVISMKKVKRWQ